MVAMCSEERLRAALEGKSVDHVPFSPNLAYLWESLPRVVQDAGKLAFLKRVGADFLWRGAPCPVKVVLPEEVDTCTVREDRDTVHRTITPVGTLERRYIDSETGNTQFLVGHPLKTEDDYKVMMWLEEHTSFVLDLEPVQEHFNGDGREGLSIGMLLPRGKSAFQSMVEHYVGTEELIYALVDYPETVEALWELMVENDLRAAELAVKADYEYYLTWEDSGTQNYSPRMFDRYIASEVAQWSELLERHGKHYIQHACGHVRDLVVSMKESGAAGIESISPPPTGNVSIADARRMTGDDFIIIGGIEPTLFLELSLAELGPYVEQVISEGAGGPYVLANSDSCPPGVTVEKLRLVSKIAKQHSW